MLIPNLDISLFYFAISVPFLILWLVWYIFFPRIRGILIKTSLLLAFAGIFVENIFYMKDYWHPVGVYEVSLGSWIIYPEFLLFGVAFAGVSAVVYPIMFKKYLIRNKKPSTPTVVRETSILLGIFLAVSFGLVYIGVNSIYATAVSALAMSMYIVLRRRDLLVPAVLSALLTVAILLISYQIILLSVGNIEELLSQVWLLYGTGLDIRFLGIPATELVWGVSVGSVIGIYNLYLRGYKYNSYE